MKPHRRILIAAGLAAVLTVGADALAYTRHLGQEPVSPGTAAQYGWPAGVRDLANHPLRRQGWDFFFSELPNDRLVFGYRVEQTEDAHRLLQSLAAVQDPRAQVHLSPEREFRWDQPAGEAYGASFSLGSQKLLNEWWRRLPGGKFGVHHYPEPPQAAPPTLILYLGREHVDLEKLRIPERLAVTALVTEEQRKQPDTAATARRIEAFVAARGNGSPSLR